MSRLRIVIVDDCDVMRASVRELLDPEFDVVGEAADGGEVLEVAKRLDPHAIIMDITMPGASGIEAARRLRADGCASAIVFLSVHRQCRIVQSALATAKSGYVVKEDARHELADAVRAVVGGAPFVSHSVADQGSGTTRRPGEGSTA